jgi:tRNA(fMet)-specific endonuclease VapC
VEPALIDTNIISMFMRGHPTVRDCVAAYLKEHNRLNLSIITIYEALSGLKHRDAKKQTATFKTLVEASEVWPLTEESVEFSAEMYAALRKKGRAIDDIDLLIAGIARANKFVIVTNNCKHFDPIEGLTVRDWSVD